MVHDLSASTDGTTERMRQETGHDCIMCPTSVRNLSAVATNALHQWDANKGDFPDWNRMGRKMEDIRRALESLRIPIDEHFEALNGWRRP